MHTMPIDPSISLNVQQFDPMAAYGKAMQLSSLLGQQRLQGVQIDQAEREQRDAVKMAEVFKRNINPDGSLNRTKLIQETADAGLGNKIPGMQKQWNEADKADADLRYTNSKTKDIDFGLLKKRLGATNGALASLLSRRDFTYQDVLAQVNRLVDDNRQQHHVGRGCHSCRPGRFRQRLGRRHEQRHEHVHAEQDDQVRTAPCQSIHPSRCRHSSSIPWPLTARRCS